MENIKQEDLQPSSEQKELIWHYTSGEHLKLILRSGELRVSEAERAMGINPPALWLSKNPVWEHTATKQIWDFGGRRQMTKEEQHEVAGLIRFAVEFDKTSFITYAKYRYQTNTSQLEYDYMSSIAIVIGADPKEWYATFKNIPQEKWVSIEKWNGTEWLPLDSKSWEAAFEGDAKITPSEFWAQEKNAAQN